MGIAAPLLLTPMLVIDVRGALVHAAVWRHTHLFIALIAHWRQACSDRLCMCHWRCRTRQLVWLLLHPLRRVAQLLLLLRSCLLHVVAGR